MNKPLALLLALAITLATIGPAAAIPKVAEDESAPVTSGADAPRPKRTSASNANPPQKKKAHQAKAGHQGKHAGHKAKHRKAHR